MARRIGTPGQDTIIGAQGADSIEAGAGLDLIYGFLGADTIDGGAGYDTLFLTGTSGDLNIASDAQLLNIEEVSAKLASGGVTINLSTQAEGFILTGSAYNDVLRGGGGTNNIDAGDGDDTIYGFGSSDSLNGGRGADTLIVTASIDDATDLQISNIENIIVSGASKGVVLNLGRQSERFYIIASAFGDEVSGGFGADVINTGAGDDKIYGFDGNDYLNGGDGVDTLHLKKSSVYVNAALDSQLVNVETISAADARTGVTINLASQSESFTIIGSDQSDMLKGGSAADTFIGASGIDTIDGGFGDDTLLLNSNLNSMTNAQLVSVETISAVGAAKGLIINLGAQNERLKITGSAYSDTVTGGIGLDLISTGDGDDIIKGFASADTIDGGAGQDMLILSATSTDLNSATDARLINVEAILTSGATTGVNINLSAQSEGFMVTGGNYSDTLKGGGGADSFFGFSGSDIIDGGKGADTLFIQATTANLNGASDTQVSNLEAISAINASSGVTISLINQLEGFSLTGGAFADQLTGASQADTFNDFVGADTLNGGGGIDTIKLTATSLDLNRASNAQIVSIEKVSAVGAAAGVAVDLSKQVERIDITGGAYDDTLTGGSASDILTGGAGADHFVFNNLAANGGDKLADFSPNVDQLDFSKAIFAGLGDIGPLLAVKFWSSASDTTAHSADDRLIYNTTTGTLYYDADGTEAATAIKIATFGGLPALTSDDIFVY